MKFGSAFQNCILECTKAQSRPGALVFRVVSGCIASSRIKHSRVKLFRFCLISLIGVYVHAKQTNLKQPKKTSPPNKKTSANLPVKSCGSLHLDTRVYFLNFCLLVSCTFARSDPISRAEWHALIVRENACAELLIYLSLLVWFSLHAARHEECVQVLCVWFFFSHSPLEINSSTYLQ